jgi:hypothetical protein
MARSGAFLLGLRRCGLETGRAGRALVFRQWQGIRVRAKLLGLNNQVENKTMKTTDKMMERLMAGCLLACYTVSSLNAQIIPPGPGGEGTNSGGGTYSTPPDIPNVQKYIGQYFSVIDTNDAAVNNTNIYNSLLTFADDTGTSPSLQILPYQNNCLLLKASHFDYSGESVRDFCLVVNDKVDVPFFKNVDLAHTFSTNNGWLIQGIVSKSKIADPMYLLVSNISRTYNGFFRIIPYSGPEIQLTGYNQSDVVSNTITLQTTITDLSGVTNQQMSVLVDGLPARYTSGTSNVINIDTRFAPNGNETISVVVGNNNALLYNPSNAVTDNKLFYENTTTLSLDFENDIYMSFPGNESADDVGTNYIEFAINQPEYVRGTIADPATGRIVKCFAGYVPYATTVSFGWDFNEADGVTPYTNDTYVFTFQANPNSPPVFGNSTIKPKTGGGSTSLTITNIIGREGVCAGGYCIMNYEMEDPSTPDGSYINSKQDQWGSTLEFAYESLYYWQFSSLPQYSRVILEQIAAIRRVHISRLLLITAVNCIGRPFCTTCSPTGAIPISIMAPDTPTEPILAPGLCPQGKIT